MSRRVAAKRKIDFSDEAEVLAEMAAELDIDPDDLKIEESRDSGDFGGVTIYRIYFRGSRTGDKEWAVVQDEEEERDLALEIVKQDLDREPEIFNKDFIERHINEDRLRRDLESDVLSMNEETLRERDNDEFWREYEQYGFDAPEEDEDGERPEPTDSEIKELAQKQTDEQLKNPMEYLEEIYGDDAAKKAIEIAGIDIDAAAEDAVDTDGAAHFLSSYDGSSYTTKNGLVYWRRN